MPRRPTKKHFECSGSTAALIAGVSTKTFGRSNNLSYSANDCPRESPLRVFFGNLTGGVDGAFPMTPHARTLSPGASTTLPAPLAPSYPALPRHARPRQGGVKKGRGTLAVAVHYPLNQMTLRSRSPKMLELALRKSPSAILSRCHVKRRKSCLTSPVFDFRANVTLSSDSSPWCME